MQSVPNQPPDPRPGAARSSLLPTFLLGVGLGGFIDGIVLHQLLQWHHMLTDVGDYPATTVAGLEGNTVADGLFHLATLILTVVSSALLLREWQRGRVAPPWRRYAGLLLVGWGAFNVIEGLVDHHLLSVHHVRDDVADPLPWDLGFLALGAVLVIAGSALVRSAGTGSERHRPLETGGAPTRTLPPSPV